MRPENAPDVSARRSKGSTGHRKHDSDEEAEERLFQLGLRRLVEGFGLQGELGSEPVVGRSVKERSPARKHERLVDPLDIFVLQKGIVGFPPAPPPHRIAGLPPFGA